MIDNKLITKYNIPGPRYTSYPPANLFTETFDSKDYADAIVKSNRVGEKKYRSIFTFLFAKHSVCFVDAPR